MLTLGWSKTYYLTDIMFLMPVTKYPLDLSEMETGWPQYTVIYHVLLGLVSLGTRSMAPLSEMSLPMNYCFKCHINNNNSPQSSSSGLQFINITLNQAELFWFGLKCNLSRFILSVSCRCQPCCHQRRP